MADPVRVLLCADVPELGARDSEVRTDPATAAALAATGHVILIDPLPAPAAEE